MTMGTCQRWYVRHTANIENIYARYFCVLTSTLLISFVLLKAGAVKLVRAIAQRFVKEIFHKQMPPIPKHSPTLLFRLLTRRHSHEFSLAVLGAVNAEDEALSCDGILVQEPLSAPPELEMLRNYLPYAELAYEENVESLPDDATLLLHHKATKESKELSCPSFFVGLPEDLDSIVVAIRGSTSLTDAITGLVCTSTRFGQGYAHRGVLQSSLALLPELLPVLEVAKKLRPDADVVLTGHSLGGGVAILMTKLLLEKEIKATCVAIAPPPVFGDLSAIDEEWSSRLHCFVHQDDIIPRVTLRSMRKVIHLLDKIDNLSSSNKELAKIDVENLVIEDLESGFTASEIEEEIKEELKESDSDSPDSSREKETQTEAEADTNTDDDELPLWSPLFVPARKNLHWLVHQPQPKATAPGSESPKRVDELQEHTTSNSTPDPLVDGHVEGSAEAPSSGNFAVQVAPVVQGIEKTVDLPDIEKARRLMGTGKDPKAEDAHASDDADGKEPKQIGSMDQGNLRYQLVRIMPEGPEMRSCFCTSSCVAAHSVSSYRQALEQMIR